MSSADTDQVGQSLLDLGVISTMSCDTLDDILGEVSLGAVALMVAVVLATCLTDPGIETLWNNIWAGRGWNWWRRLGRRRLGDWNAR